MRTKLFSTLAMAACGLATLALTACDSGGPSSEEFASLRSKVRSLQLEVAAARDSGGPSSEEFASLRSEVRSLQLEVATARDRAAMARRYLQKDPEFFLFELDYSLEEVEAGRGSGGSFTDYFVPTMSDALTAGASRKAVEARLERLIALAEEGKAYSSWVADAMSSAPEDGGGPDGIRSYAWSWLGISQ